ncbi:hypothetical protein DFH08DRAFT_844860 [Mycena albidolilacea]|uniref:N-acetyltransferase domain-containing protein n=1 Tax=Mycena albidolilacea TaxID=1033008 RepID=A0AAD7AL00_9AGAR|nr:hypothetical protein DFH08DRAFT_844860 [Mycena albidolilacea]
MASALIRPIDDSDDKLVRFMVAKANMESLAAANRRALYSPLYIAVWLALSAAFIEFMDWYPKPHYGFLGYLQPLPGFATIFVPLMFAVDWINRPYFEDLTQAALRAPDMRASIKAHYSRSPASGFWIVEYGDKFVGLIAIDASTEDDSTKRPEAKTTATIRHFYVQEPYPAAGIQDDLLSHAVNHCFNKSTTVQQIKAPDSPLVPYARKSLKEAGFILEKTTETVGLFRWKLGMRSLQREKRKA